MKPILEVQQVSKKFLINQERLPYFSLRDALASAFSSRRTREEFWALKDVSVDVMPGESMGIIGRNGAGKSTLLKILSRITPPTEGRIVSRGKIASLLEVGTGFHQELSGRENIYMNGSILGMKKSAIDSLFDEIVDFSGVEKFLDTPIKHYSSGMQLRLAFAVAAHLDPEILIIDEVLAVGDAEFQKKCINKMEDVAGKGRTVLFVSHNLPSMKTICKTGILLREGRIAYRGSMDDVINHYTSLRPEGGSILESIHYHQPHLVVHQVTINGGDKNSLVMHDDMLEITLDLEFKRKTTFALDVHLKKEEQPVVSYSNFVRETVNSFDVGRYQINHKIKLPSLRSGKYGLDLYFTEPFTSWFAVSENVISIEIMNSDHHIFLNNPSLKWGSVLASGTPEIKEK